MSPRQRRRLVLWAVVGLLAVLGAALYLSRVARPPAAFMAAGQAEGAVADHQRPGGRAATWPSATHRRCRGLLVPGKAPCSYPLGV